MSKADHGHDLAPTFITGHEVRSGLDRDEFGRATWLRVAQLGSPFERIGVIQRPGVALGGERETVGMRVAAREAVGVADRLRLSGYAVQTDQFDAMAMDVG